MELTGELLDDETFDVDTNCNAENDEATVLSQAEHGNGNDIMEDVVEEKETVEAERMDASIQDDGSMNESANDIYVDMEWNGLKRIKIGMYVQNVENSFQCLKI